MKLYTRTGDDGSSGLFGGDRVSKSHLRLEAYGTLDELNSIMGLLRLHATAACAEEATLQQVQQDLFVLGAILATPASRQDLLGSRMSRPTWDLADMEADIDRLSALAPPMTTFVLPGGTAASAHAHLDAHGPRCAHLPEPPQRLALRPRPRRERHRRRGRHPVGAEGLIRICL